MNEQTLDQFRDDLKGALEQKKPFSMVSIGDGEALFLLDIDYSQPDARNGLLHNRSEVEVALREKTMEKLKETDYIFAVKWDKGQAKSWSRETNPLWKQHVYSYPKVMELAGCPDCKLGDLSDRYRMPVTGHLFEALKGKKVLTIGFHGKALNALFSQEDFKKFYNCDAIPAGFIECSQTNSIKDVPEIIEKLEKLKPFEDYDCVLVAIGIPANYVCLKIKEMGGIALDMGQAVSYLAGFPPPKARASADKYSTDIKYEGD